MTKMTTSIRNKIIGIGSYLPERVLRNAELAEMVDTSDEWIKERTGISQRHIAAEGQKTSDLGYRAAMAALDDANLEANDIDLIVVATSTPDLTFPSTATIIQERLGMNHGAAFDIQAVCSGFIYGMNVVDAMMRAGNAKRAMLIGAETFSRILDWEDRGTCVLFGDGAGAVILEATYDAEDTASGVLHSYVRSDGRYRDMLYVDGGPSATQTVGHLRMQGNAVFKHAVTEIANVMRDCAEQSSVPIEDIDWFVPHQANQRILNAVAKKLKIAPESVISTVEKHANTSAASVPLAMNVAIKDGRIKPGDLVMLEAFGGGFTWGAALLRY
ncbi:MAG: beta-ketoacyl-ACP synthase III [Litorimonas sp.]